MTLIGATTENPYFEVNSALLSRCQVVELRGARPRRSSPRSSGAARRRSAPRSRPRSSTLIARRAGGDARTALEHGRARLGDRAGRGRAARGASRRRRGAQAAAPLRQGRRPALRLRLRLHQVDARLRSRRGRLLPRRRCSRAARIRASSPGGWSIFASEDVGNADPRALQVAVAAAHALEHVGLPEAQLNLSQAAIYLANAPKSKASANAIWSAREDVREGGNLRPPAMLRDAHYAGAKKLGHGAGLHRPAHRSARASSVDYLPDELKGRRYYRPSGNGEEAGDGEDRDGE